MLSIILSMAELDQKPYTFILAEKKWTKTSKDFITGIYTLVECAAFAPQIIRGSFADNVCVLGTLKKSED